MKAERRPISDRLRTAIKISPIRAYLLARRAGIHRATLRCWMNRIATPANQAAVVELGRILGVPANECFEPLSAAHPRVGSRRIAAPDRSRRARLVGGKTSVGPDVIAAK